jgi:hypothetical protein
MRDGDHARCLALDTRVCERFAEVGDLRRLCQQRANVGYDEMMLGAYARAEQSLRAAIEIAERMGLHQVSATARHNLGMALARQDRLDEARTIELAAVEQFTAQDNKRLCAASHDYLAQFALAAGDLAVARRHSELALAGTHDVPALQITFCGTASRLARAVGDSAGALGHAARAIELMSAHGPPEEGALAVRLAHAEALHAAGRLADARLAIGEAEARLLEAAARIGDPAWRRSYLEAVPEHAATLALAHAWR